MRYLPHTAAEIEQMLAVIGKKDLDELFSTIPDEARLKSALTVPAALDEPALMAHLSALEAKNPGARMLSFLGAGAYSHHIPPAVDQLLLRSEFYTAYTPYQPEVAQGTLQAIWEFQTMVSEIYGLPLANASLYDGASATAEAALMARRLTRRSKVLLSGCVHPDYRATTATYLSGDATRGWVDVPVGSDGRASLTALSASITDQVAAVIVGYPSFLGPLTELGPIAEAAHAHGALLVVTCPEPYALAIAESPGAQGADIVVGEGQPLACTPNFGGPGVGLLACRQDRNYLQQLPGRVAGETVDAAGRRGYVLTLSTREQHIRRDRATSNICTNQGLVALSLAIRTSLLGKTGFIRVAEQCLAKASYLRGRILELGAYGPGFADAPFFNEFAIELRRGTAAELCQKLEAQGILAGFDLGRVNPEWKNRLLIAVTELHPRADLDRFVAALAGA